MPRLPPRNISSSLPGTLRSKRLDSCRVPGKQYFLSLRASAVSLIAIVTRHQLLFLFFLFEIVLVYLHPPSTHHAGLKTNARRCSTKGLLGLGETGMKLHHPQIHPTDHVPNAPGRSIADFSYIGLESQCAWWRWWHWPTAVAVDETQSEGYRTCTIRYQRRPWFA